MKKTILLLLFASATLPAAAQKKAKPEEAFTCWMKR